VDITGIRGTILTGHLIAIIIHIAGTIGIHPIIHHGIILHMDGVIVLPTGMAILMAFITGTIMDHIMIIIILGIVIIFITDRADQLEITAL